MWVDIGYDQDTTSMSTLLHFDLTSLIKTLGYLGIFAIVFSESGLLVGFFLPGDSLLFTAGFLASQGFLDIRLLIILAFVAAVVGDSFGYAFGYRVGPRLFTRNDSLFFNKSYIDKTHSFYKRYGGKTLILARFMPVVRTFAPILAGVGNMPYRTFLSFNVIGGLLWVTLLSLLGYFLGTLIPNVDHYLLPIIALIILVSLLPGIIHILRDKQSRTKLLSFLKLK